MVNAHSIRDDGQVGPGSIEASDPNGNSLVSRNDFTVASIALLVLEEDNWIVIANSALEQPFAVPRRGRDDDLEPWDVTIQRLDALRVVQASVNTGAKGRPEHRRHAKPANAAPTHGGSLIDDLIKGGVHVVRKLELGHGAQSHHRGANRHAGDTSFSNWHVQHPQ